jgi:hypothetical protein
MGCSAYNLLEQAFEAELRTFRQHIQELEPEECLHLAREIVRYMDTRHDQPDAVRILVSVAKNVIRIEEAQDGYYNS